MTIIHPDKWYDGNVDMLKRDNQTPDDHCHTILWLFSQVINFFAKRSSMDKQSRQNKWESLFDRLTLWTTLGSEQTRAIVDVDVPDTGVRGQRSETCFPTIIFSNNSSGK